MNLHAGALSLLLTAVLLTAGRAEPVFRSGPRSVALIELYTSEGCSSCPPAEKWLGERSNDANLWHDFVPVAFHVNYWDHLGWRDALASKAFTDREYAYADAWRASSVYTPCFVRNGLEWRPRTDRVENEAANEVGTLTLRRAVERPNRWHIEFEPVAALAKQPRLDASVALLGSGIVSRVRAGENSGRELRHEFVALRLETVALRRDAGGTWTADVMLAAPSEPRSARHAIAAWVSAQGQLKPLQAVGGWLE